MSESWTLAEASGDPAAWWAMTDEIVRVEMTGPGAARALARQGHDVLQSVMRRPPQRHRGTQSR